MSLISVDTGSPVPVYEQIRHQVVSMVGSGVMAPGSPLPTIRQLAADLGLAKGTVNKAYETLMRDGVIVSRGRHGSFISEVPPKLQPAEQRERLAAAAYDFALVANQLGVTVEEAQRQLNVAFGRLRRLR
jgi:GntR family transcriptional regulator